MNEPTFYPGTRLMMFDSRRYVDDRKTPLSVTIRPATVLRWYGYRSQLFGIYPSIIDVMFDGDTEESIGHFAPEGVGR